MDHVIDYDNNNLEVENPSLARCCRASRVPDFSE